MRSVEITVPQQHFGDVLGEMREWIDRNGGNPVKFETESDECGAIRVKLEFVRAELGSRFRQHWVRQDWARAWADAAALAA